MPKKKESDMGERMAKLEVKMDVLQDDVKTIKYDVKDFIEKAEKTYAKKGEVDILRDEFCDFKKEVNTDKKESKRTLKEIVIQWTPFIVQAIFFLGILWVMNGG